MEDWQRSDRQPDHTVFSLKLGHNSRPRNKKKTKLQTGHNESPTDDKDYFKVIADCRPKRGKHCSCFAVHWKGRHSRDTSVLLNSHWCQHGTVRFTKRGACGKVKRKRMNHIAETRYVGRDFIVARYISLPLFRKVWNTRSQSRSEHRMEQTKWTSSLERQESKIHGRNLPLSQERWKNCCWWTLVIGRTPN